MKTPQQKATAARSARWVRPVLWLLLGFVAVMAIASALLALSARWLDGPAPPDEALAMKSTPAQVERGRYLALAGNCASCHTARGGAPYAGGLGIETPFGAVYTSNLTPDRDFGLGSWNAAHFWRAMHHGVGKDGRALAPAFPYTNYTRVSREDSDAIFAWLRTLAPVAQPNRPHALRFPYDSQAALRVWRALFFRPGEFVAAPDRSAEWNRGAYLVGGLGHCSACHGPRNDLGATEETLGLSGGLIAVQNWYAPSLTSTREAGVADWPIDEVVQLLGTGRSAHASMSVSVMGPMAEVVFRSTQFLAPEDLRAMAVYLRELPQTGRDTGAAAVASARSKASDSTSGSLASLKSPAPADEAMLRGQTLYDQQCAYCHGDRGQGAPGAYPPLAGNRAVLMDQAANLVQIVRHGGFAPTTAGNPRPYGMPPFGHLLGDREIADVLSYIRGAWGNSASAVSEREAMRR